MPPSLAAAKVSVVGMPTLLGFFPLERHSRPPDGWSFLPCHCKPFGEYLKPNPGLWIVSRLPFCPLKKWFCGKCWVPRTLPGPSSRAWFNTGKASGTLFQHPLWHRNCTLPPMVLPAFQEIVLSWNQTILRRSLRFHGENKTWGLQPKSIHPGKCTVGFCEADPEDSSRFWTAKWLIPPLGRVIGENSSPSQCGKEGTGLGTPKTPAKTLRFSRQACAKNAFSPPWESISMYIFWRFGEVQKPREKALTPALSEDQAIRNLFGFCNRSRRGGCITPDTEDTESAKEIETPGGIPSPGRNCS